MDTSLQPGINWKALLLGMGTLLALPVWLNVTVGGRTGVWFAPYPVWMFGMPVAVAMLLPPLLFVAVAVVVLRTSHGKARFIALSIVLAAVAVHFGWALAMSAEGVMRLGLPFTAMVQILGFGLLIIGAACVVVSWRPLRRPFLVFGVWFAFLWLSWFSVPWFLEGP
jgi:hypothetical protein